MTAPLRGLVLSLACAAVAACEPPAGQARTAIPSRIVSLNPTTTELIFALGAAHRLVGRSRWDVFPAAAVEVPEVGDALRPNIERVLAARPDLVILYESAENAAAVERLARAGVRALVLRIDRLVQLRHALDTLGVVLGDTLSARVVGDSVFATLGRVRAATAGLTPRVVFWRVWEAPLITIGRGSFLDELITIAGGRNVYHDIAAPAAPVSLEDVVRRDPDIVLAGPVSAERLKVDPRWRALRAVREGRVLAFDTMLVGRPSVRVGEAALSLARLLHPGRVP
ncbi:MAG: ABC transporter substrate-binding protein [Gemmatimonadaceae bacterium]